MYGRDRERERDGGGGDLKRNLPEPSKDHLLIVLLIKLLNLNQFTFSVLTHSPPLGVLGPETDRPRAMGHITHVRVCVCMPNLMECNKLYNTTQQRVLLRFFLFVS